MVSLEKTFSEIYHLFGLDRIKSKVLAFTLLAILIPTLTMGWQSFHLNKQFITAKISEELQNATTHTVREFNLWLKERFYEMRVFSSSYEVTENLEKLLRGSLSSGAPNLAHRRLTDFLKLVQGKFSDYEALMVVAPDGKVLSTSKDKPEAPKLLPDWLQQAKAGESMVGEVYWDETRQKGILAIAVPIKSPNGKVLGILAGKLNFRSVEKILKGFSLGKTAQVYLVQRDGSVILSSRDIGTAFLKARLSDKVVEALFKNEQDAKVAGLDPEALEYLDPEGTPVLGTLWSVAKLPWGAVAEIGRKEAYAKSTRIVNLTLMRLGGLLAVMGLAAYFLGFTIVRPLERLTEGASKVAGGNLEVKVPVVGHGEVAYLTEVFNDMVGHLRQSRTELAAANATLSEKNKVLKELSITDGLTGLFNRKHLMEVLVQEINRARRFKHPFSILMIDIDHFKQYNDTYGHLAGDRLLAQIGALFKSTLRDIDFAARYGGEEFLIMFPEVGVEGASKGGERLRAKVESDQFIFEGRPTPVRVSIGVSTFPEHGSTAEALIEKADAALYQAKRKGRNRVVVADGALQKAASS